MTYILVFAIFFEPINRFTQYFVIQSSQFAMTSIGGIVVLLFLLLFRMTFRTNGDYLLRNRKKCKKLTNIF